MRREAERLHMHRPHVITANPLLAGFGDFAWAGPVTYYVWDNWTASEAHRPWWRAYEAANERIRDSGRRVCGVSEAALRPIGPTGPNAVVPNGVDPREWLDIGPPPDWFAGKPRPRLLYIGTVDARVDIEQATATADAYASGSLTFVGDVRAPDHFAGMRDLPNVEFHRSVPRAQLTSIIKAADVCLIPHVRNALTEAMSPLKLYEYLAGGRPVAAVDLAPIAAVAGRVTLVGPHDSFPLAVGRALAMGPADEEERLAFVHANAWSSRFETLLDVALANGNRGRSRQRP
jgi:teichuronic acid biosynthesis glycosyltransferase TuaH